MTTERDDLSTSSIAASRAVLSRSAFLGRCQHGCDWSSRPRLTSFARKTLNHPGFGRDSWLGQATKLIRSPISYRVSNSTGGLPWQAPCNRRLLYQSTHAAVATSTS
jgi:hypothetical protein